MTNTPRHALPEISASQAQKHVTHNLALLILDALSNGSIIDRDLATPPGSPADGDTYLVAGSPTGAWAGQAGKIAFAIASAWSFYPPFKGLTVYVADEGVMILYNGSSWVSLLSVIGALQNLSLLGLNTTADATNKLAVASSAVLFSNVGNGIQVKVNKAAAGDTASFLFQDAFSGRAEIGLMGDDDFQFKVSPDGSAFKTAIAIDKDDGSVFLPEHSKFSAYVNFDRYVAADTWTLIDNNNARHNDQGDWGSGLFTAPHAGYYLFGAGYRFKANSTVPTDIKVGLSINAATPTADRIATAGDAVIVTLQSYVQITGLIKLTAGQTVSARAYMTGFDGYVEADSNFFWGCQIA